MSAVSREAEQSRFWGQGNCSFQAHWSRSCSLLKPRGFIPLQSHTARLVQFPLPRSYQQRGQMRVATRHIHAENTDKAGCANQHREQCCCWHFRQGWRPTSLQNGGGRDWWPRAGLKQGPGPWAGWGQPHCGAEQGQSVLLVPSEPWQVQNGNIYFSEVLHICLKVICPFIWQVDNIRNNYFSQLNRVTINAHNKTSSTVSQLLKCTCSTKFYAQQISFK